ncbi:MAG: DNA-binding protein [Streptomycetaceae bacterium]|jgi:hypothetical protein|nr:DNA-binding protein [Streptomycetaceae bacterium]NUS57413.1 DNA-binding protein [Streptomycetaceae bacterium]
MTEPRDTADDFPRGVAAPARRALNAAGYAALDQLAGVPRTELAALHGMGPRALDALQDALAERGLSLG